MIYKGASAILSGTKLASTQINQAYLGSTDVYNTQPPVTYTVATGGTITTDGDYKIHTFTAGGTFTVSQLGTDDTFEILLVGGGGGGGSRSGGGGGGGGVVYMAPADNYNNLTTAAYSVTIGAGGAGAINGTTGRGVNGSDSVFTGGGLTLRAKGGGGGGGYPWAADGDGANGGSGGAGQAYSSTVTAVEIQTSQAGDSGLYGFGSDGAPASTSGNIAGGGGGAGGVAPSGTPTIQQLAYIDGADGKQVSITGTATYYAGGGGGGDDCANRSYAAGQNYRGFGGQGGGGNGETCGGTGGSAGTANTGGGGGGGGGDFRNGFAGGSGIFIIRYKYQ